MFDQLAQANIPQIKAAIEAYPQNGIWFHGCGNMYADKKPSDDRQKYTNPNDNGSEYRIHFTSVKEVPATLAKLKDALMKSRNEELANERKTKTSTSIKTVKVEADSKNDDEAELQRLIDEENAKKGK